MSIASDGGGEDVGIIAELRRRVRELEQRCDAEKRQTELATREKVAVKGQLDQLQEQVIYMCIPKLTSINAETARLVTTITSLKVAWRICTCT